uniref:Proteasome subunit beta n=1 Tax=Craspedostauros australis TaxID=1486917 RepID=A0A7R9ZN72_9STRA|mmetsp:Transcript_20476/g.56957  ORF Transcript_20476/g.56957 Transcript_20476/m.56957 type:complete len:233 (+) Transcript_20476:185-883(+)|eukprot:CAMPEP_0198116130 /NCGR_PEP_ID=MMETSP1442-20131203/9573_1 /TAXON_ID= /ORGANISM="Craspedostauros australis, Strain CCMP3328" /LENGTH=232 /DNA_ID=CAMNT_0043773833 /DNA_START=164 /DNA_END=862 /DNA_ORIENTATION=-
MASLHGMIPQNQAMPGEYPGLKPGEVSTGTTILALPFDGGVVVCADSRTSTGTYVANRVSDKLVQLSDYIYCCRSGSAADTQALTDYVHNYLSQLELTTGRQPTVKVAAHLMRRLIYNNKDNLMAGVIIAGWDEVDGGSIYNITLGGTALKMPYAIGGSGSIFITGFLDSEFRAGMSEDEARALAKKACSHAMTRDGSSGGVIRTVRISEQGVDRDYTRGDQLPFGPTVPMF